MAWFSYFLLSVPEAFLLLTVPFALLGISIKKNLKSMIIFAFVYGGAAFSLSIFLQTSLKPFITITIFSLLVAFFFRFKILHGFIIGLISFVILSIFEMTIILLYIDVFSITYEQIFESPWLRIILGIFAVQLPLLLTTLILLKFKVRLPLLR
ncbi:hypothetical protein H1D32_17785 [Anaerobacillus sp. CMMVII]|uniref:hypothetical protein n=1 Tax=Anaerobacillus sp. CMMVII TaxID=2755588 RepID=UPI0021B7EEA6|nr:hypothetical protein [Anaerobacillus sp. CMMVII]MCT8139392.1 hypothetical protein [Anaerobacillus sp. CMMVII]